MKTKIALMPLVVLGAFALTSCGTHEETAAESEISGIRFGVVPSNRFTAEQIRAVYSEATEVRADGRTYPLSKPVVSSAFLYANAPAAFRTEWGNFTAGGEMRGYLNLGFLPTAGFQNRLIRNFEAISTWTQIRDTRGNQIFQNAFTVNPNGIRMDDWVDGMAPANGEIHNARLTIDAGPANIDIYGDVDIRNNGGEIQLTFVNTRDVRAPLVGTVIKKGGMRVLLNFWPHERGWLSYGASAVKLEQFGDQFKPEQAEGFVTGFFNWVKEKTITPVRFVGVGPK